MSQVKVSSMLLRCLLLPNKLQRIQKVTQQMYLLSCGNSMEGSLRENHSQIVYTEAKQKKNVSAFGLLFLLAFPSLDSSSSSEATQEARPQALWYNISTVSRSEGMIVLGLDQLRKTKKSEKLLANAAF